MDPAIFFPTPDRGPALDIGERYGVWVGLGTTERALLAARTTGSTDPRQ